MKLVQLVVSLDLAKQMKKAGYPQKGLFYWVRGIDQPVPYNRAYVPEPTSWEITMRKNTLENFLLMGDGDNIGYYLESLHAYDQDYLDIYEIFVAPTASELSEQLKFLGGFLEITYWKNGWRAYDTDHGGFWEGFNLANCLAKMWLDLKQQGLLPTKDVK